MGHTDERTILHCDCNSFFASVETAKNPAYRDVPMAVCGSVENRHGIVLAKNERAKRFGVVTAETVTSARRKCPDLIIVPPHYDEYVRYSHAVREIFSRYTDCIEPFGIDEAWLDVSASARAFGTGEQIAHKIRESVRRELGITVSVGVSFNKTYAKLGSDYKKPDAVTLITRENFRQIVYPLPVGSLLFVGRATEQTLRRFGVRTIGDLAALNEEFLTSHFGKAGNTLYRCARAEDDSPVAPPVQDRKSIGNGLTFRYDLCERELCRTAIAYLCEEIGQKLRHLGLCCSTVVLRIRDENFSQIQRQCPQNPPTDLAREIAGTAYSLFCSCWSEHRPVRMLTVTASGLIRRELTGAQVSIFSGTSDIRRERGEKRESAVDEIRGRYGRGAIVLGSVIGTDIGIYEDEKKHTPPSQEE